MIDNWTPREQRSREKWRSHIVRFQYNEGLSREEMAEEFARQATENTDRISPINSNIVYNSANQVLKQLSGVDRPKKIRLPLASSN